MTETDIAKWRYQRYMQDYLGTIKSVDENVGRVLDYLGSQQYDGKYHYRVYLGSRVLLGRTWLVR
ncbi:hypothetical protein NYZ99_02535 [Maribacter litopenaei]|uniref:Uncharacterized protein n=1 Tax=Maribacter litopenaei TaxID=2976127 RepID=A0ABY5YC23_9FLAO|nr:hypothetical protein [Maribacter litopenaei]UWX55441.1 hypothetical protein NYZ99_02535 [Maribacter litopenaei]